MVFRIGVSQMNPVKFTINMQPVSNDALCQRLREQLDQNEYVDIEPGVRDLLPDPDLIERIEALQIAPQIVPPINVMGRPQVTHLVARVQVAVPNSIQVWTGSTEDEFSPDAAIDAQTRLTNDPYVKITRVWFPWNEVPNNFEVVHMSLYGQHLSSFRMRNDPVDLNMFMIPGDAPIVFRCDNGVRRSICMEFIYELEDSPRRESRNQTVVLRHRHSPNGGTVSLLSEQLVTVRVHVGHNPPPDLTLTVDRNEVPLYRAGEDLEYCASIVRDNTVVNDGPSCLYVQLSHAIPMSVTTKAVLDITSRQSRARERQRILDRL